MGITGVLWRSTAPLDLGWGLSLFVALCISLFFSLVNALLGLHKISWHQAKPAFSLDIAFSSFIATLLLVIVNSFWQPKEFLPQGLLLMAGVFSFLGFLSTRYRDRLLTGLASRWIWHRRRAGGIGGERVLIVGAGDASQLAIWFLEKSQFSSAFSVIGMVDDDLFKQGDLVDGYPVLGTTRELPNLVEEENIGAIVYAISNIEQAEKERILRLCKQTSARLVLIPDLLDIIRAHFIPQKEAGKQ